LNGSPPRSSPARRLDDLQLSRNGHGSIAPATRASRRRVGLSPRLNRAGITPHQGPHVLGQRSASSVDVGWRLHSVFSLRVVSAGFKTGLETSAALGWRWIDSAATRYSGYRSTAYRSEKRPAVLDTAFMSWRPPIRPAPAGRRRARFVTGSGATPFGQVPGHGYVLCGLHAAEPAAWSGVEKSARCGLRRPVWPHGDSRQRGRQGSLSRRSPARGPARTVSGDGPPAAPAACGLCTAC